ncbi:exopolysaccharide phosphotransferase cps2G [Neisseria wadsworthii 9715]|uniref:Exopolysaccharide phosphotransferase cps2G n=1 Tax=Neisseria wadsworthii 9715 TaxID=1030841 RepID=G4CRH6_9NEIS|nr:exopolysaccharide phosphotransferase cps2G [Neisseria wadsworthii 9715]
MIKIKNTAIRFLSYTECLSENRISHFNAKAIFNPRTPFINPS